MAIMTCVRPRPTRPYLTIKESIEWYDTSRSTLYRLMREHRLTPQRRDHDHRTYLAVEELERELTPRPIDR
jgi:hypothetical protein